jgi:hypothetical protein
MSEEMCGDLSTEQEDNLNEMVPEKDSEESHLRCDMEG